MNLFDNLEFDPSLLERLKLLPTQVGVYLMRDPSGQVIYVGKAKNIRSRVKSYFKGQDERAQVRFLLRKVAKIDAIVATNENQAFILERDLIAKHKPRYNIRLKDNKEYLSIRLDRDSEWPRIQLVRQVTNDGAQYFGPYSFSHELKAILDLIKRVVPLRTCSDTVFYNRQRPCLEYQIKRCAGPCCLPIERATYAAWVKQAIAILEGRNEDLIAELERQMLLASEDLRFEEAAILRDRHQALLSAKENRLFYSKNSGTQDVFGLYRQQDLATLSILRLQNGRIKDCCNYAFESVIAEDDELLETALQQFYENRHGLPEQVVLDRELPNQRIIFKALLEQFQHVPQVVFAQRGVHQRLVELAKLNAQQHFTASFEEESKLFDLATELARLLKLKQVPRRIECIDISNLQGSDTVGALVVFEDGKPNFNLFRKYILENFDKPDDFAAIYEVCCRRFKKALEQNDLPDLLIIDGGQQQLAKAIKARDELGVSLEIVALAKIRELKPRSNLKSSIQNKRKPERFFLEDGAAPVELELAHPVTFFVQRIRDEVHKQVINFHRYKRGKRALTSMLDGIRGIGPDKRKRLYQHFGSLAKLRAADCAEIAKVGRMPASLAQKILDHLS